MADNIIKMNQKKDEKESKNEKYRNDQYEQKYSVRGYFWHDQVEQVVYPGAAPGAKVAFS